MFILLSPIKKSWFVKANPDGRLFVYDRKYNSLFWESFSALKLDFSRGFLVKSEEAERFLHDKLQEIGLRNSEANEFISFWLPLLIRNKLSLVSFQFQNYVRTFPLLVTPNPDSVLRVFLGIKRANGDEIFEEQYLPQFERNGFCVVEWGGSNFDL